MHVILRDNAKIELSGCHQVKEVLKKLEINPESVLVLKDGKVLTQETVVDCDEEILILPVLSGGDPLALH